MKYLFLLLILPLLSLSFLPSSAYAQEAFPIPSIFYCVGNNPQPPCATIAPTQPGGNNISPTAVPISSSPSIPVSQTPSQTPSQNPLPSTSPCGTNQESAITQSARNTTVQASNTKTRKPTGDGLLQQLLQLLLQLLQYLFQQLGGQTPGTTTNPSPTSTPGTNTNPCPSSAPNVSPTSGVSSAPTSAAVSPTVEPTVTPNAPTCIPQPICKGPKETCTPVFGNGYCPPSVSPTTAPVSAVSPTTPPTSTAPPSLLQQLLQLLLQLLQYLFQQLGITPPCSSTSGCPTVTPTVPGPNVSPTSGSGQPSSGTPSSSAPSSGAPSGVIATPTVFTVSPVISQTQGVTPTPPTATTQKAGLLESDVTASGSTTNKLCLDDYQQKAANGNKVVTWACNSSDKGQVWVPYSDDTIHYNGNTNYCLEVSGTASKASVFLDQCSGNANQKWSLTNQNGTGRTELKTDQTTSTPMCLDINQGSQANNTQLQIYKCNNGNNQAWSWNYGTLPPTSGSGGGSCQPAGTKYAYKAPTLTLTHTTNQIVATWSKVTGSTPCIVGGVPAPTSYTIALYRGSPPPIRENKINALTYTENGLTKGGTITVDVWANGGPLAPPNGHQTVCLTDCNSNN